ncbi:23S rRNA pseudouridine(1911/1915/1917) synthase [Parazoarcus communis]|uniref:Pseudouridine synthase n=1 Tax=Parazoarcus communis TaxID=41977 RepID=A0A2U8GK30_9RHOO|nr:23S rRNA pseudouridine(1911/1915/1917) synthase RluD [Parazoarcus communis]AWI73849.1 23S rRNA pseudouridine(1911/1915/1917) synthase [Parazoarcus communis]TVT54325.1 MAG: 23S rRNA pseudouridine(1911/1915/1917) synthase RluD [Azoarcus sp. PHD]
MNLDIDNTRVNELKDYSLAEAADSRTEVMIPRDFAGMRIDQALARLFPEHSRSRLQAWLRDGRILVDGGSPDAKHKVWGGERLVIEPAPEPQASAEAAEDIPLHIVFEDEALLVIDKPAGLVVHPGSGNWSGTLLNALLHHAPALAGIPRAGIVHRLDKDTSGLLVVAKTLEAQTDLIRQLQARTVKRHYLALVHGGVKGPGEVDAPIARHPTQRTRMAVVGGGRQALTRYVVRERLARTTLVECRLETGRTHQIRVHMAHIGHPLVGDPVYGLKRSADPLLDAFSRQALHAFRLGLVHPASGDEMAWFAPLPDDFSVLLHSLGGSFKP